MCRPHLAVLLCAIVLPAATGLRGPSIRPAEPATGRRAATTGLAAALLLPNNAARAADKKYDKAFEECLSKCVYTKTKITKGIAQVEVMSRSDAFAECKKQCATNKNQLLLGQPKNP